LLCSVGPVLLLLTLATRIHPLLTDLVNIVIIYTALAIRDLRTHALRVYAALVDRDLPRARQAVAMLVGRDTDHLDERGVARAAVESVAENTVDGITAPLLFAFLGGAPGAIFYKAVNTLDSTYGYKNEQYLRFGRCAARLDDLVNFLPARLTALLVPPAAVVTGLDAGGAWRIFRRDRKEHPSPNGGQIEAAMAGALRVRLGGENRYFGVPSQRPFLGDDRETLQAGHILRVVRLMLATTSLVTLAGALVFCLF
jgi:adenosylcobinamide-phosphate synthase